jgi:hypothetical protein
MSKNLIKIKKKDSDEFIRDGRVIAAAAGSFWKAAPAAC